MRQNKHSVRLYNRVESVSNCDDRRLCEFFLDKFLDLLLRDYVDVSGGLVQNDDFVFPKDCTADANQLALSTAEIFASLSDFHIYAFVFVARTARISLQQIL